MDELFKSLVDSGWSRLALSFRYIRDMEKIFISLVNGANPADIARRYAQLEERGFFIGDKTMYQQVFLRALFAYDPCQAGAFHRALSYAHPWEGGTVKPLRELFDFIRSHFFNGPFAEDNKQALIGALLEQPDGEPNALSRTAQVKNPTSDAESNPLTLVLNFLEEAGCYTDGNKQKLINGILAFDKRGGNSLENSLEKKGNFSLLLHALAKADIFTGSLSEINKQNFTYAVLAMGEGHSCYGYKQMASRLEADGAELTEKQKRELESLFEMRRKVRKETYSLADYSLFADKQGRIDAGDNEDMEICESPGI